jgi:hypothetical protein
MSISCFQITQKLLALGAEKEINYQEPTKGNAALHIAYARRDFAAIKLLEHHGASQNVVNFEGDKPADMLALSFEQANKLMAFHTSPDNHPSTFVLDSKDFNNLNNLEKIKEGIVLKRPLFESAGKETVLPGNPFFFGGLISLALQGRKKEAANLIAGGASPDKAIKSLEHRLEVLNFIQEDNPLHSQEIPWDEYIVKRNLLDKKHVNPLNPYMYDLIESQYIRHQEYIAQNRAQFTEGMTRSGEEIQNLTVKFTDARGWLESFTLSNVQRAMQAIGRVFDFAPDKQEIVNNKSTFWKSPGKPAKSLVQESEEIRQSSLAEDEKTAPSIKK